MSGGPAGADRPVERELKFRAGDLGALRDRLLELQAEREGPPAFEDNWIFDRDGELQRQGCVLRVRDDGKGGALLTFKGRAQFEGAVKVRDELELRVSDATEARTLLEALGYAVVRRYQKMREAWRLGAVTICLDHTPIGDFVEFEGERAETLAKRCGFRSQDAERRTYLGLYLDYLTDHPEAPADMVFR
jgi:predicted adenylyl cyclase CyaB